MALCSCDTKYAQLQDLKIIVNCSCLERFRASVTSPKTHASPHLHSCQCYSLCSCVVKFQPVYQSCCFFKYFWFHYDQNMGTSLAASQMT